MNTHILYNVHRDEYKYFSGEYTGELDIEGFAKIDFKWSNNMVEATEMNSADAWDLLSMCRYVWPKLTLEIKRIKTFEEVCIWNRRCPMEL